MEPIEKIHNVYLSKIVSERAFDRNGDDFRQKIKQYLADYDEQIRQDYVSAQDEETKKEIEEIYATYSR